MDKRLEEIEGGAMQTPKWEFNGEVLIHYGSALTPTGRGHVLKVLEDHERLCLLLRKTEKDLTDVLEIALSGAEEKK